MVRFQFLLAGTGGDNLAHRSLLPILLPLQSGGQRRVTALGLDRSVLPTRTLHRRSSRSFSRSLGRTSSRRLGRSLGRRSSRRFSRRCRRWFSRCRFGRWLCRRRRSRFSRRWLSRRSRYSPLSSSVPPLSLSLSSSVNSLTWSLGCRLCWRGSRRFGSRGLGRSGFGFGRHVSPKHSSNQSSFFSQLHKASVLPPLSKRSIGHFREPQSTFRLHADSAALWRDEPDRGGAVDARMEE